MWVTAGIVLLAVLGSGMYMANEALSKGAIASQFETILQGEVVALRLWIKTQEAAASSLAMDPQVVEQCAKLVETARNAEDLHETLLKSADLSQLRKELTPVVMAHGYQGFYLVDERIRIVGSDRLEVIGVTLPEDVHALYNERVFKGMPAIVPPRRSLVALPAADGQMRVGVPTMFAVAPVKVDDKIVGALALRIAPEGEFSQILSIGRPGKSGESYAFNRQGELLSQSRFDDDLRRIGLLRENEISTLTIQLRDPETNLTRGNVQRKPRGEQSLTHMAKAAIEGTPGVNVDGYRDYRGVPTVGAWTWLDDYGFGIAIEQDAEEAFAVLASLRRMIWGVFLLAISASAVAFFVSVRNSQLAAVARNAAMQAKRLGQYHLEAKLGQGGMGVVYRARHAMLQRPTAVKLLDIEKTNPQAIARFEREVKLTCQLTHPNTIIIFDYGRTPEGIFYYAMEYLEGLNLDDLILRHGPQPDARVIHILQQVCGSLAEAHGIGLIHRDIKPANIVLTRRGGLYDFAKLLDFGLVKAIGAAEAAGLTAVGSLAGTPLYVAPESIDHSDEVDARCDLYGLGAVGYYLLTGTPVFRADTVMGVLKQHLNDAPEKPSTRLGREIDPGLEAVILKCLSKDPKERPQTAQELAAALAACASADAWTQALAGAWWQRSPDLTETQAASPPTHDDHIAATMDINEMGKG